MSARQLSIKRIISGFSLLEVLLALFVSLVTIIFLTQLYLQRYHYYLRDITRTQQEIHAMEIYQLIQNEVERAGQIGCARMSEDFNVTPYLHYSLTSQNKLQVTADTLEVRYQSLPVNKLKQWINSRKLIMTSDLVVNKGDVLLISDCVHAEIFTVAFIELANDTETVVTNEPLQYEYNDAAEIGRYVSHRYFLKKQQNTNCLIRENQHHYHEIMRCELADLQFQQDEKGVAYQFQLSGKTWSGYAAPA